MVATMSMTVVWLLCLGVPLAMGLWAQSKVKRTFRRWSEVPVRDLGVHLRVGVRQPEDDRVGRHRGDVLLGDGAAGDAM